MRILIAFIFFILPVSIFSQEICNNSIDDDADGLIDLNDPDCACLSAGEAVISLIENPSFEENSCCPSTLGQFSCLRGWQWGDEESTTDYLNTCDFILQEILDLPSPPMPLPDGNGFIGFLNGDEFRPEYKEYTGSCLIKPLQAGNKYKMSFFMGFSSRSTGVISQSSIGISIFGAADCSALPFQHAFQDNHGCPTEHDNNWRELGTIQIQGQDEWVQATIEITPNQLTNAIIIGPSCAPSDGEYYHFMDLLRLEDTLPYELHDISILSGTPCSDDITLTIDSIDCFDLDYQWFKNGIAIQNGQGLTLDLDEAIITDHYQVRATGRPGCALSEVFTLESQSLQLLNAESTPATCPGLADGSIYVDESYVGQGVSPFSYSINGQDFQALGTSFEFLAGGQNYTVTLRDAVGCEDTIQLRLGQGSAIGLELGEDQEVELGESITVSSIDDANALSEYLWSVNGEEALRCVGCSTFTFTPLRDSRVHLTITDPIGCQGVDSVLVRVLSNRNLFIPNVFSPNDDGLNDFFVPFAEGIGVRFTELKIYNRWGDLIHNSGDSGNAQWNGESRGSLVEVGVYIYTLKAVFLDGTEVQISSDLSVLR